jgi:hypothetical protein
LASSALDAESAVASCAPSGADTDTAADTISENIALRAENAVLCRQLALLYP